jgi:hypothetical protein
VVGKWRSIAETALAMPIRIQEYFEFYKQNNAFMGNEPFELQEKPTPHLYFDKYHITSPTTHEQLYSDPLGRVDKSVLLADRNSALGPW